MDSLSITTCLKIANHVCTHFDDIFKFSDNANRFFQEYTQEIEKLNNTLSIITVFLQDNKDSSAEIDIVVALGLAGQTCSTWTKSTKLAESFSTDSDTMYWVGDFRQRELNCKGVRKLQFGYNGYTYMNGIVGMVAPDSIQSAKALLDSLMLKRRTKEERERPIVFVASSLGGMVVKQALLISKGEGLFISKGSRINTAHWHCSKCNFTYGVISLGTPHAGSYSLEFDPIAILPHGFHKPASSCGHQVFYPDDGMVSPQS